MYDTLRMEIRETLEHLQRVDLQDTFVLNTPVLEQRSQTSTLAVFLEDVHLVSVHLDAVVLDDIWVMKHLHNVQLVLDL